jgi:hypothetical protein
VCPARIRKWISTKQITRRYRCNSRHEQKVKRSVSIGGQLLVVAILGILQMFAFPPFNIRPGVLIQCLPVPSLWLAGLKTSKILLLFRTDRLNELYTLMRRSACC